MRYGWGRTCEVRVGEDMCGKGGEDMCGKGGGGHVR